MFNKNDPLIGAVQQIMQKSNAERAAVKAVNEKFGVVDRKALPRERQGEWDAAYQSILTEGTDPSKYSPKQKQLAAVAGNKNKIDAPDLAAARKGGASHIKEADAAHLPYLQKKGDKPKLEPMPNAPMKPAVDWKTKAKKLEEAEKPSSITPSQQSALKKKIQSIKESNLRSIQEEIANNLAEQASTIYENSGAEGLAEFIDTLSEEQIAILQINEKLWDSIKSAAAGAYSAGMGALDSISGGLATKGSAAVQTGIKNVGAAIGTNKPTTYDREMKQEKEKQAAHPVATGVGRAAGAVVNPIGGAINAIKNPIPKSEPKTNDAIQNMNKSTSQQSGNGQSGPNRGLGSTPAAPAKSTAPAAPKPKAKPAAPKAAAPKAAAPKVVAKPVKKTTPAQRLQSKTQRDDIAGPTRK